MQKIFAIIFLGFFLTSCAATAPSHKVSLRQYNFSGLKGWSEANSAAGLKAFQRTCSVLGSNKLRSEKIFAQNKNIWRQKCMAARNARSSKRFFEDNFTPYLVTQGGSSKGKFTGYFEKTLDASLTPTAAYRYPIYTLPADKNLLNLTRREIENGGLKGKGLELAYAKDPADLYFLHVQGSGLLKLPDGRKIQIGYIGNNNYEYKSIGKIMLDQGMISKGTAQEISQYIKSNPVSGRSVMNMNDRYVFFTMKNTKAAGSLGVELTDRASLAVDTDYIPLGMPIWLQTYTPDKRYFSRVMNAQDTGGAIKGPIRGDIFFGSGEVAWRVASDMNQEGSYFLLVPKEIRAENYF